eukprot:TRINITY_DN64990_c0_g1_i1.p1 TRINITY_DN64990_c0_g1~~TRINITY_DN64990_c0_g1_i1.p1  ORF type:complete len:645 (-),score=70.98 TRINITY_DN64990_c0_g1_i1:222-2156(-)
MRRPSSGCLHNASCVTTYKRGSERSSNSTPKDALRMPRSNRPGSAPDKRIACTRLNVGLLSASCVQTPRSLHERVDSPGSPGSPGSPTMARTKVTTQRGFALRAGQVLAPSRDSGNDPARVLCSGTRLRLSSSEPGLRANLQHSEPFAQELEPRTPRSLRGVVRRASKVSVTYPVCMHIRPAPAVPKCMSRPSSAPVLRKSTSSKKVSFSDESPDTDSRPPELDSRSEASLRAAGRWRSAKLMVNLFDLRRIGKKDLPLEGEAASTLDESKVAPGLDDPLMVQILKDTQDTADELEKFVDSMRSAREPLSDLSGTRHATAVISARALTLAKRKHDLVSKMEARIVAFEAASARKEDLFEQLVESDLTQLPGELTNDRRFISALVHNDGEPVNANKSDFESFALSFGLPSKHKTVATLRSAMSDLIAWWLRAILVRANENAHADVLRRLINAAVSIGADRNCDALQECGKILADRLAIAALDNANKLKERDAALQSRSTIPQVGSALEAANKINDGIRDAVANGAPVKHQHLQAAKKIANELLMLEKTHLAELVLHKAREKEAKDAKNADALAPATPEVGPASALADAIDRDISEAREKGALETHAAIKEALDIAKRLRDKDGERKRMAAREKRLAAKSTEPDTT